MRDPTRTGPLLGVRELPAGSARWLAFWELFHGVVRDGCREPRNRDVQRVSQVNCRVSSGGVKDGTHRAERGWVLENNTPHFHARWVDPRWRTVVCRVPVNGRGIVPD